MPIDAKTVPSCAPTMDARPLPDYPWGEGITYVEVTDERITLRAAVAGDAVHTVDRIVMVVGPEGGVGPAELTTLTEAGAVPVLLGPHVLRSSTAGPAATAVVQQLLGRFGSRS